MAAAHRFPQWTMGYNETRANFEDTLKQLQVDYVVRCAAVPLYRCTAAANDVVRVSLYCKPLRLHPPRFGFSL